MGIYAFLRRFLPDEDHVFAYDTVKLVRVLDRRLGFVFYGVQLGILTYVVIGVFIINKAYLDSEKASGWITVKVMNPQLSHLGISWDVYETTTNPGEMGAVFIPTRVLITRGQTQEDQYCESYIHNCTKNSDCDVGNEMLQKTECQNGHCMRRQWCPAENPDSPTTEAHYLEFGNVDLWFKTFVHFSRFQLDVSTTDEKEPVMYPARGANTFPLHHLIRMANVDQEELVQNGGVMLMNALFNCDLDSGVCDTQVEAQNVDTVTGYNYVYNHVYWQDGIRKRDSYRMYGIRLMAFTTGLGVKASFSSVVMQISSGIALLTVAEVVADFVMMQVLSERNHYKEQKIIQTEDFNPD